MKGWLWIIERFKGKTSDPNDAYVCPLDQALAVAALGEDYLLARWGAKVQPGLKESLETGVSRLIAAQCRDGGWADADSRPSDAVLTAWSTRALYAAKLTGLKLDGLHSALERALKFALSHQQPSGDYEIKRLPVGSHSVFGEALMLATFNRGTSMFSRSVTEEKTFEAERRRLLDYCGKQALAQPLLWNASASLNEWFMLTLAIHEAGGEPYHRWNHEVVLPTIVSKQQPDGQWQDGPNKSLFGNQDATARDTNHQRMCIAALVLEAPYRLHRRPVNTE